MRCRCLLLPHSFQQQAEKVVFIWCRLAYFSYSDLPMKHQTPNNSTNFQTSSQQTSHKNKPTNQPTSCKIQQPLKTTTGRLPPRLVRHCGPVQRLDPVAPHHEPLHRHCLAQGGGLHRGAHRHVQGGGGEWRHCGGGGDGGGGERSGWMPSAAPVWCANGLHRSGDLQCAESESNETRLLLQ